MVTKQPFAVAAYYNPCCDEMVQISGMGHLTIKTTTNSDGTVTLKIHSSTSGVRGTGLSSGISYNGHLSTKIVETVTVATTFPLSVKQSFMETLVGRGRGGHQCSYKIKGTYNLVIDADGNVTFEDLKIEFICANGTEVN